MHFYEKDAKILLTITIKAGIAMAKNDFDIDFDFEKEYGFNPDAMGSEYTEDDFDLSGLEEDFSQEETARAEDDFSDFDLDGLDLSDHPADDFDLNFEDGEFSGEGTPEEDTFAEEESAEAKPSTLPPRLSMADSKDSRVRVEGSKNSVARIRPCMVSR